MTIEFHPSILWCIPASLLLMPTMPIQAEVVRIAVTATVDVPSNPVNELPPYEESSGRIFFAVDPHKGTNRRIADIGKAPLNVAGKVEFSADFALRRPKNLSDMNGVLLFEAPNRGSRTMVQTFNKPLSENSQWDDAFLMRHGFTLLWVGWQFDVPAKEGALRIYVPVAHEANGHAIRGLVRSDATNKGNLLELADRNHIPYLMNDPDDEANVLTVRDCATCERRNVPREQWRLNDDGQSIFISTGQPQKVYEVVYKSANPPIAGLGLAAVRDAISELKYAAIPEIFLPAGAIKHAVGFGASQGGRFLRSYNYFGFNEDEQHRRVFDGMIVHAAGAGRGSFNQRFAQPSRDGHPYLNFFYPTDIFPFTDAEQFDPETGRRDGLLKHLPASREPTIFYTNASYEYWGRCASLIHTSIDGRTDARVPANVRIYFFAGGKHGSGGSPSRTTDQQQISNPLDYSWGMRGLLIAMNDWLTQHTPPPPSAYPRISNGTLVPWQRQSFPEIPGVGAPGIPTRAFRMDYGPSFLGSGIVTREPPELGSPYPILVPNVDGDGNDLAGIKMPEFAVPLATYTGWALMDPDSGPPNVLATGVGSFIPFPGTKNERLNTRDPRRSVAERYNSRSHYLALVTKAANELADGRYVLKADIPAIVEQAAARWDFVSATENSQHTKKHGD